MPKYSVSQIMHFSAAHVLRGYELACEKLHGHNYKVIVEISSNSLNNLGMVIDYYDIQKVAKKHITTLDHTYLNELEFFKTINPTTENIAAWLYKNIQQDLNEFNKNNQKTHQNIVELESITIWENDDNFVKYSK